MALGLLAPAQSTDSAVGGKVPPGVTAPGFSARLCWRSECPWPAHSSLGGKSEGLPRLDSEALSYAIGLTLSPGYYGRAGDPCLP